MRDDPNDDIGVVDDLEEKAPGLVHPALPNVVSLIDLPGA
jgi:hypothetical protein